MAAVASSKSRILNKQKTQNSDNQIVCATGSENTHFNILLPIIAIL